MLNYRVYEPGSRYMPNSVGRSHVGSEQKIDNQELITEITVFGLFCFEFNDWRTEYGGRLAMYSI